MPLTVIIRLIENKGCVYEKFLQKIKGNPTLPMGPVCLQILQCVFMLVWHVVSASSCIIPMPHELCCSHVSFFAITSHSHIEQNTWHAGKCACLIA